MAEEIAHRYPALPLADVYSVFGYHLRRQREVESAGDRSSLSTPRGCASAANRHVLSRVLKLAADEDFINDIRTQRTAEGS